MNLNPKFPLFLPGVKNSNNDNVSIIGANLREDITTVAYYISGNGGIETKIQKNYPTKEYSSFSDILKQFVQEEQLENVKRLGISVPGPVLNGKSNPARLGWSLDIEEFKNTFGVEDVCMLNDQEAAAYGIALLEDSDLDAIYSSGHLEKGNVAILAPGNGLGEAGYFFDGKYLRPFATEGGHSEFSPRTNVEVEFYQFLNNIYGIVSWENVLSKTGLFNIYRFLRDVKRHPEPEWLSEKLNNGDGNFTEEIFKAAMEEDVMICKIALDTFLEFLAREANNLTLKLKATGGLLIAGDIPQIIRQYIDKDKFYEKFKISDKMEDMLKNIPIYLINTDSTSINGAALYTAYYKD
ncbi:glucokinase [Chryseobacterium wangxinyae]|uniref:glucokinase n=1 Tax=unclassified Chryseobacterium TaxID=2593645 RepID=UPI00226F2BB8|nr:MULTISPECIES: glucokinase [unclassified Chryseobacterium]MCY0967935.1 glucokinase [Chryseobacterium sp. CY353]MCY0977642.1 glucokinase [Chryseobacterium sp. CY350]WBZ95349.1 glucokinase [Chryseobacterium sp. CY350]